MPYLDKEKIFYDYGTKNFDGKNPFDTSKTGIPFYNQFLTDPGYMEDHKNLRSNIVKMSPTEYFEECAKIFESSKQSQMHQIGLDTKILTHLKDVLLKYKKTFPLTFLNYAEETQEGRHRMYLVGELLGWDKKFPVMVIDWADQNKEEERKKVQLEDKKNKFINYINHIAKSITLNEYDDLNEVIEDFKYYLDRKFLNTNISASRDSIIFSLGDDINYKIPIWEFNVNTNSSVDYGYEDYDYEDMNLTLESFGLKNW